MFVIQALGLLIAIKMWIYSDVKILACSQLHKPSVELGFR